MKKIRLINAVMLGVAFVLVVFATLFMNNVFAQEAAASVPDAVPMPPLVLAAGFVSAALAIGISSVAAAIAVSNIGTAAMGAMSEKPELAGRALIFVGLAEGIAIYGLIVAIMILGKLS